MNTISEAVHEYVDLRRSLGYKLVGIKKTPDYPRI